MSAPVLWIVIPGLAAGVLYLLRRWEQGIVVAGVTVTGLLAWLGSRLPIDEVLSVGPWSVNISSTMWILGRRLVLTESERPLISLIYLAAAFWFGGALAARRPSTRSVSSWDARAAPWHKEMFVPVSLGIVSLLMASLAVDPFLYAALFIEIAAFLCIPLLASPQKPAGRGILRFLTFQTLGAPFILFTGWVTADLQSNPDPASLILRAALLAGLGFSFLLAIFPLHTWLPMLSDEAHPYMAAFIFYLLPGAIFLFAIKFLGNNPWLSEFAWVPVMVRAAGGIMVLFGGLWAAFQRKLGRMLAYAVIVETGLSLLTIDLQWNTPARVPNLQLLPPLFFSLFVTRGLALGTWALALSAFHEQAPGLRFRDVHGLGRRYPIAACALILAHFSLAGFPLLAGFPVRLALIENLAVSDPLAALWILISMVGLLAGALRTLAVLVMGGNEEPWTLTESRPMQFFLLGGMVALILSGILAPWE